MTPRNLALFLALVSGLSCQQPASEAPDVASTSAPAVSEVPAGTAAMPDLLPNLRQPADGIISGGQPTPEQLAAARDAGYRTVINLRRPDEPGVGAESEIVSGLGMEYVSIPIEGAAGLTRENVEAFAKALETAEYPLMIHCSSGNRNGALFALKAFWMDGKSPEEALEIGLESGLTRLEGPVRKLMKSETGA